MYEQSKLAEAEYFFSEMLSKTNNPRSFQFELSAFLSAARSVLQYACSEVKGTTHQIWYDNRVNTSLIVRFFKDKRDFNIHVEPFAICVEVGTSEALSISLSESVNIVKRGADGNVTEVLTTKHSNDKSAETSGGSATHFYTFPDWSGKEDVLQLAKVYLAELKDLVKDGMSKGILSG